MKFYAFNDNMSSGALNLILDHNTTQDIAWTSNDSNTLGPREVLTSLYNDTKDWLGTITPKDYTMDQSTQNSGANYTIEYSKIPSIGGATTSYKARLITLQEIAQIMGIENFDETIFDNFLKLSPKNDYGWLYDKTDRYNVTGYWTASSHSVAYYYAWNVLYDGTVNYNGISVEEGCGVRPVIEVLKSNLS